MFKKHSTLNRKTDSSKGHAASNTHGPETPRHHIQSRSTQSAWRTVRLQLVMRITVPKRDYPSLRSDK